MSEEEELSTEEKREKLKEHIRNNLDYALPPYREVAEEYDLPIDTLLAFNILWKLDQISDLFGQNAELTRWAKEQMEKMMEHIEEPDPGEEWKHQEEEKEND